MEPDDQEKEAIRVAITTAKSPSSISVSSSALTNGHAALRIPTEIETGTSFRFLTLIAYF
jgi:hypothetical protein